MKTLRNIINPPYLLLAGFFFAGCYTQMESLSNEDSNRRDGEGDDYAYTDSTNDQDSGGTTVNNYFYDDGYRSSRYRMSFHYYYPSHHMWEASIWFDPWYDDFYSYPWDPWYRPGMWYPTIAYPYPYWYPRSGYYPHYGPFYGYGYGHGNNYPVYGGGAVEPGRRRTTGSTRGDESGPRTRGSVTSPSTIPVAGGGGSEGLRTRTRVVPEAATTDVDRGTRKRAREEVPWWERMRTPTQDSPDRSRTTERARVADDNAPAVSRTRGGQHARVDNKPVSTVRPQGREQKTTKQNGQKQVKQRGTRQQTPQAGSGRARQKSEPSYKPGSRQEAPRYSSPPRESGRSRSGNEGGARGGGERSRRER